MVMDDAEFIYDSLTGQYIPEAAAKDVEDAFAPGQPCHALYKEASGAYDRLCDRLGVTDEDEDEFCWWLRTPGEIHVGLESDSIKQCYVGSQGFVYTEGESTCVYNVAVRPAMWVLK